MTPVIEMYRAMQILILTKEIRNYLEICDPKSLEQLQAAIKAAETLPEVQEYEAEQPVRPPMETKEEPVNRKVQELSNHLWKMGAIAVYKAQQRPT